jgi:hypothetical protein
MLMEFSSTSSMEEAIREQTILVSSQCNLDNMATLSIFFSFEIIYLKMLQGF